MARRRQNLREYDTRRHFDVTPEPRGGAVRPSPLRALFMVHKHHARRLHYDLRLEMSDALASWAVPKGPSYDPAVKRLAVQTEDHPLEYAQFEGRIPEGEYGAGDSIIWDRGTWDTVPPGQGPAQRQKGHLVLDLDGAKLHGRWHLVRTRPPPSGKAQWLLFKARDEAARPGYDVVMDRPESVASGRRVTRGPEHAKVLRAPRERPEQLLERVFPPMLATLVDAPPPDPDNWIYELKYDGFRALAGLAAGRVALLSRNRLDLAGRFAGVARGLASVRVGDAVIDGEIVALDERGRPRFQLLQSGHDDRAIFYAFDLLWLDGQDVRARPLEDRRELLESLLSGARDPVRLAERVPGPPERALARAARSGWEGLIAKQRGSTYQPVRSRAWLKLKAQLGQEVAIVGFTKTKTGGRAIGALLLGVVDQGELRYAGKVGTGFTSAQRTELYRTLSREAVDGPRAAGAPRMWAATWVEPRLVAQVRFTEWTADGKLRHPAFQGLRPDKSPMECVRERPLRASRARPTAAPAVTLSHPERELYPKDGITKKDIADYYDAVAAPMLAALADRPLALQHWPRGIGHEGWFQQNIGSDAEPWMTLAPTPTRGSGRIVRHLVADRPEALRWLAQHSVLDIHMWSARAASLESPDWMIFDLDPDLDAGMAQAARVAHALRGLLDELRLPSMVKTSGKRGLHVLVPLAPGHTHEQATQFALRVGETLVQGVPEATLERAPTRRRGRLYVDCLQNGYGKTIVAPYSPRGVDGAPVSAPLDWREVTARLDPGRFTVRTMSRRLREAGDRFAPAWKGGARLPRLR